ncbi:mandelate racemase [Starkeya koreensis]|uniref:Mandelate racemase n=1 Tax=Ancylobacter koreensis TaxID=266121 RepID=A0ABT0DH84_9HYPH|nr:enolase C-terminal domain-like protein [Ancylobacter koreensis]MCK0206447.1 mandelate racemase [Ancylobacter koreensis]
MRIVAIHEATIFTGENRANAVMNFSDMTTGLVAVVTDVIRDGKPVVGYGFGGTGRYSQNAICRERLIPRILAAPDKHSNGAGDNLDPFAIWDCMMSREKPGGHGDRAVAVGTIDMAVWDAAAKIADMPLAAFLAARHGSGEVPDRVPVYVGGGYYYPGADHSALQDEIRRYHDDGFKLVKIKIGGAPLDVDRRRIESLLEITDSSGLAVDANGRFARQEALSYAAALEPYKLAWLEEPAYPLDYALHAEVAQCYQGPIGTGESLLSTWDARNMLLFGGLRPDRDILMFDCALSYGICEYIRTIEAMEQAGWSRASVYPHGGHLLSLHITAGLGLGATEAYPYTHQPMGGFTDGLKIADGLVDVPDLPGIGFEGKSNFAFEFRKLV